MNQTYKKQLSLMLIAFSFATEVTMIILQLYETTEAINRYMFFNTYILLFSIVLYYIVDNVYSNFLPFGFFACFCLFLMAQKPIVYLKNGEYNAFLTFKYLKLNPSQYFVFTFLMYSSILGIFFGHQYGKYLSQRIYKKVRHVSVPKDEPQNMASIIYQKNVRILIRVALVPTFICAFLEQMLIMQEKRALSYTAGYLINVDIPTIIKIGSYLFVGIVMIYFATKPPKKELYAVMIGYVIVEGGIQLFTGRRALIGSTILFVIWYLLVYYNIANLKNNKKYFYRICLTGFIIIILFWFVEKTRSGSSSQFSLFQSLSKFMTSTGGSDSVIANTIDKSDLFPKSGITYLLFPLKNALLGNPISEKVIQLVTGITNTVTVAQGVAYINAYDSFSHWISYLVSNELYTSGHGMGSSYIAETYLAFGVMGPFFISVMVGMLIHRLSKINLERAAIFRNAFGLCLISSLFKLPRNGLFEEANNWFYCLVAILVCYTICNLTCKKR